MSRWDALKPDGRSNTSGKQATSSDSSKRRRPQPQHVPATTARWQGRHQPTETSFPRRNLKTTHVDEWDRILERLQQQLEKEEKINELSSSILQNLQQLSEMFDTTTSATSRGKAVAILVKFLPNQEQSIQQDILGVLNHLLENPGVEFSTKEQANKAIVVLSSECQSSGNLVAVQCLTRLMQASIKYLPAEETAHGVVAKVFLPRIEAPTCDSLALVSILQVLTALVADSRHASALLAPLVQDVGLDGKEEQVFNPRRQRLFSTLQRRLLVREEVIIRQEACHCLARTLLAAHRLDGDHHSSSIKRDVDMGGMERFLVEILARPSNENVIVGVRPLLLPALELLRVLIKRHPDASAGIGTKLLVAQQRQMGGARKTEACTVCSKHPCEFVTFIEMVHSCSDIAVVAISTFCLADLIETMPLQKWLGGPKTTTRYNTSSFGQSIIDSLEIIIEVTRCRFLRPAIMAIESLSSLAKVILAEIPYQNERLVTVASQLWASLGELVYTPGQSQQVKITVAEVLVDSMGGRVTPQGHLTPMCIPARVYLSNSSSTSLLNQIISSIECNDGCFQQSTEMLRGMLRTRPKTAHVNWDRLHIMLLRNAESDSKGRRLSSLQILEGLVLGRKDFGDDTEDELTTASIATAIDSILRKTRIDPNAQCRGLSFQSYAGLLARDWIAIGNAGSGLVIQVDTILGHCGKPHDSETTRGEPNANARSAACKAIGEFCTQCLVSTGNKTDVLWDDEAFIHVSRRVLETMLESLEDSNASVRCMALFAIGNLANSIRGARKDGMIDASLVFRVCIEVEKVMQDSNDKVSGNAIRSIGHLGNLLFCHEDYQMGPTSKDADTSSLFRLVVESLSEKVANALVAASTGKNTLSWKERSVSKKHGWGACNSLGLLLQSNAAREGVNAEACLAALQVLVECVQQFWSLNEKIAIGAMSALGAFEPTVLSEVAGRSGLIGSALAICAVHLYEAKNNQRAPSSKVQDETEMLLSHLLLSASILDAWNFLKKEEISKSTLDFLYEWMVERDDLDARAFEIFALAFQRSGLSLDYVSLEQNFASRALQQYKKIQVLSTSFDGDQTIGQGDQTIGQDDGDEADEL